MNPLKFAPAIARSARTSSGKLLVAYDGLGRMKAIGIFNTDIEFSAVIQPPNTAYTPFNAGPFSLLGGDYILSLEGLNPNGGDNTAFVDAVMLNNTLVANGSFEVPNLGPGNYAYRPPGGTWNFVDSSGISSNGSPFTSGNPPAPDGQQVGFLQVTGAISQTLSLSAGTYTLQFRAAQRGNVQSSFQQFRVELTPVGPVHVISGKTFVWSGNMIAEERDYTGATVKKRFFAEGEQRIGGIDAGNYYYTRDHLGSVREVTDATGALKGQYDYDAWGNSVVTKGKMQVDFGYSGHYLHQQSGLNLAMYRGYHPNLGRWLNRDPIAEAGGINLYGYVDNNPVNYVDPFGLCRNKGEPFYDCLDRHARDFWGQALDWSDTLGIYSWGAAAAAAGTSLLSSGAQAAANSAIQNAPLAGARAGGSMTQRIAAAAKAAQTAGRLSASTAALGFLSKASAVVGTGATIFSLSARANFTRDCMEECCN